MKSLQGKTSYGDFGFSFVIEQCWGSIIGNYTQKISTNFQEKLCKHSKCQHSLASI